VLYAISFIFGIPMANQGTSINSKSPLNLNLLSLNVRGLNKEGKRNSVYQYIRRKRVDVSFLQETYSTTGVEDLWRNQWGGEVYFAHGTNHSKGVMVMFRPNLDIRVNKHILDKEGRFILLDVSVQGEDVILLNIYAPTSEQEQVKFYSDIDSLLDGHIDRLDKCIIGGDMNIIRDPSVDRKGGNFKETANYRKVMENIDSMMEVYDLCDVWRIKNPDSRRYTWRQKRPSISSRLDMWFISNALQDFCFNTDIVPSVRSDHSCITLSLRAVENTKGRGYWKLNNTYLDDEDFVKGITDEYETWVKEAEVLQNVMMTWEYVKYKVRDFSVRYGKKKAKGIKDEIRDMENLLKEIDEALDGETEEEKLRELESDKAETEAKLRTIDDYKTEGLILRSRVKWYEKGEKSNEYFLRLARRGKVKTTMTKLQNEDGEMVTDQGVILNMQADYYKQLYSERGTSSASEIESYINSVNLPRLDSDQQEICEGELSEYECRKALEAMKTRKSPGNDGLTVEFYRKFWTTVSELLVASLNMSYRTGDLTTSQKQAVIILLDKGKDRTLLKNWRPISLLNTDYKIASRALADRLKSVLPHLISNDQVGYIKGRSILDNIRAVEDILFYTKTEDMSGILMALDFEKAYDSCSWTFLERTLKKFNIGESFIKWVKTFYSGSMSCVSTNGHTSKYFELERGVRQGDPLSPYLFVMVVEVLAGSIRQNEMIKGIKVSDTEIKVLQYADDTNGTVEDIESAKRFLAEVDTFGTYSGLQLNKEKTEAMWLGSSRNSRSKPLGLSWSGKPLRILGVYCSYSESECDERNFDERVKKCRSILNEWKSRNLTMIGRVQILKTFIVSQFLFITSALVMPQKYVDMVNRIMIDFIWRGKKHKLAKDVLYRTVENGGLGVPELGRMISVSNIKWMKKMMNSKVTSYWKVFVQYFFRKRQLDINILMYSCYNTKGLMVKETRVPLFYVKMLHDWCKSVKTSVERKHFIWYNQNITVCNQPVLYRDMYEIGIRYISDMLDTAGKWLPFEKLIEKGISKSKWLLWQGLVKNVQYYCNHHNVHPVNVECSGDIKFLINEKSIDECTSKFMYNYIRDQPDVHKGRTGRYVTPNSEWQEVYTRPVRLIHDVRTREFQYRFIHDILINNYWLYKWKLVDSEICRWCKKGTENIYHVFWDCQVIKRFWKDLNEYCSKRDVQSVDEVSVFYGDENELLCCVIYAAKRYVYKCLYMEQIPSFNECIKRIDYIRMIEYNIALRKNKIRSWNMKWKPLLCSP